MLSRGIADICSALCDMSEPERDGILKEYTWKFYNMAQHTLDVILSRGVDDTWTRRFTNGPYSPFWRSNYTDEIGFHMWARIEDTQSEIFTFGNDFHDRPDLLLELIERQLDLWSAAIWDAERWDDIEQSLLPPDGQFTAVYVDKLPSLLRSMITQHRSELRRIDG